MKISVCMATYNGERYIYAQITSILNQLSLVDELIISDDSSTDNTISIINDLNDKRIRLFTGNFFRNPIYNFENCISHATGDIIFLSDQDDSWLPNKVEAITKVLRDNPSVTLVASDASIVDEKDETLFQSYYSDKTAFTSNVMCNIVKNRFLGCTIVFRKTMLDVLLPFPSRIPMHDSWIGIMNQIFGSVYFIDTPLIAYRRHSLNFTSSSHAGLARMIAWRWNLTMSIICRWIKFRNWKPII